MLWKFRGSSLGDERRGSTEGGKQEEKRTQQGAVTPPNQKLDPLVSTWTDALAGYDAAFFFSFVCGYGLKFDSQCFDGSCGAPFT